MEGIWRILFTLLLFHLATNTYTESEITSEITSETSVSTEEKYTSCDSGWFQFGDMCYNLGGNKKMGKLNWTDASKKCREAYKGNLIAIHSRELNDFITTFLVLSLRESVWIGFNDRARESAHIWDDGSPTTYVQWEPWEPWAASRTGEDCVELGFRFHPEWTTGNWNDIRCDYWRYFVCQKEKEKFSKRNLDPRFCSSDVGGGWKLDTSCFNFVPEKKTWAEAEEYCVQNFQGHLATITDFAVDLFLNYTLRDRREDLWIGYRIKNKNPKLWSSGWQLEFENWEKGRNEFNEGSCAARGAGGKWVTRSCTKALPFVCEYSTDCSNPKTTETHSTCFSGFSSKVLIGVTFCVLVVGFLIGMVVNHFRLCERCYKRVKKTFGTELPSLELKNQES